jgi:glycosyltransferase involved in cell wall biosynthesis
MGSALISVIIPTFNREQFIDATLNSIINQSYPNWEAIVVDDGSTDLTKKRICVYEQTDTRIKFFERNRHPKGGATCRNIGLQKAQGDYVIFLDSDDILAPWCLEQRVACMEKNAGIDFGVFHAKTFKYQIEDGKLHTININLNNHLYHFIAGHCIWQTMCPIWKRGFLLNLDGFDESFQRFQDAEFHVRALTAKNVTYKVFSNEKYDCYYRLNYEIRSKLFWNKVVDNNILFIEKDMKLQYSKKLDPLLFKKSITIVSFFSILFCLQAEPDKAKDLIKVLKSLKSKDLLGFKHYNFFILMLKFIQVNFFKFNPFNKAVQKFIAVLAFKNLKQF